MDCAWTLLAQCLGRGGGSGGGSSISVSWSSPVSVLDATEVRLPDENNDDDDDKGEKPRVNSCTLLKINAVETF